jgi:ceramide glucosyltransferase
MVVTSIVLFCAAAIGLALHAVQLGSVRRHMKAIAPRPQRLPGISILKPLCGIDDDLAGNLELFATLPYPEYELLLGVRSVEDAAYPLARAAARRHPRRVRVLVQAGEPGLNPKVNQLITLAAAARHELLVVSDSNVRVDGDYLHEIAAHLERPEVGLVTHAIVGVGEARIGSLMDNLHLAASIGAGMIASHRVIRQDIVVGKSMALRNDDLKALGGFECVMDVLAEDYLLGRRVERELRKRVAVAHRPIKNVSRERSVLEFFRRYQRWSVIHRQAVGPFVYASGVLLNPILLALLGLLALPSATALGAFGVSCCLKIAYDGAAGRALRPGGFRLWALLFTPAKDLLIGVAWAHGFLHRTVEWRSNQLRVLPGTRLELPQPRRSLPEVNQAVN